MKTAGLVLGIVGGALSILFSLLFIFGALGLSYFSVYDSEVYEGQYDGGLAQHEEFNAFSEEYDFNFTFDGNSWDYQFSGSDNPDPIVRSSINWALIWMIISGIGGLIGGILGIIGGIIIRSKRIASGVMLIFAAVLSILTILGILSTIILIIACIFAFIEEKPPYGPLPPTTPSVPQPHESQPQL